MGQILDSDWSRENLLRSDWLVPRVALYTTHQSGDVNFAVGADPGTDATDLATGDLAHPVFIADSLGRSTPRQVEQITLQKDDRVPQRHHFQLNSNC